jgi:hypothetical protein
MNNNSQLDAKEQAYLAVISEMRGSGFNDKVYEPLAEMLLAQENEGEDLIGLAFAYAFYVSNHEGNSDVLKGMESEDISVKTRMLEVLRYNAQHNINDMQYCENAVRELVTGCRTEKEKLDVLEKAKKQLEEVKEMYE